MKTYNFKAKVTDKKTGKETIVSGEYETKYHFITDLHNNGKYHFITDLHNNGYSVKRETVKQAHIFDAILENTNCTKDDWKCHS